MLYDDYIMGCFYSYLIDDYYDWLSIRDDYYDYYGQFFLIDVFTIIEKSIRGQYENGSSSSAGPVFLLRWLAARDGMFTISLKITKILDDYGWLLFIEEASDD